MKYLVQNTEELKAVILRLGLNTYFFSESSTLKPKLADLVIIDTLLSKSKLLWGLSANEFLVCSKASTIETNKLVEWLDFVAKDVVKDITLIIPYVDGGLVVFTNNSEMILTSAKPANWWRNSY